MHHVTLFRPKLVPNAFVALDFFRILPVNAFWLTFRIYRHRVTLSFFLEFTLPPPPRCHTVFLLSQPKSRFEVDVDQYERHCLNTLVSIFALVQ